MQALKTFFIVLKLFVIHESSYLNTRGSFTKG